MGALGNTPRSQTVLSLEAGKSFAFGLKFLHRANSTPVDLTGSTIRMVVAQPDHKGGDAIITRSAVMLDAELGLTQINLQAADLNLAPAEYPFTVTLVAGSGYSTTVLKGYVNLSANVDGDVSAVYEDINSSTTLAAYLESGQVVEVHVDKVDGLYAVVAEIIEGFEAQLSVWRSAWESDRDAAFTNWTTASDAKIASFNAAADTLYQGFVNATDSRIAGFYAQADTDRDLFIAAAATAQAGLTAIQQTAAGYVGDAQAAAAAAAQSAQLAAGIVGGDIDAVFPVLVADPESQTRAALEDLVGELAPPEHTHDPADLVAGVTTPDATKFYRGDGAWEVPTDTTYETGTLADIETGDTSAPKVYLPDVVREAIATLETFKAGFIEAKGDLVVGTGAGTFTRLPVGTDAFRLVADSSQPTGLNWVAGGGGGTVITVYDVMPTGAEGVDGDLALVMDPSTPGELYEKIAGVWTYKGTLRGPAGADADPGDPGDTYLPISFQIEGEVHPLDDQVGFPAPFDMTVEKVTVRLSAAPTEEPIVFNIRANGVKMFTEDLVIEPGTGRTFSFVPDVVGPFSGDSTVFTLLVVDTGPAATTDGPGIPVTIPLGEGNVVLQNSDTFTQNQTTVDDPANAVEDDILEYYVLSGKDVLADQLPAGWSLVDAEQDDDTTLTTHLTHLRKVMGPGFPQSGQVVKFSGAGPWASICFRVPSNTQGASVPDNSVGYGSTGVSSASVPALTTVAANETIIKAIGARQGSGVSSGIDTATLTDDGSTLIGHTKSATATTNMMLALAYRVRPTIGTEAANSVSVVSGTGTNARFVASSSSWLPEDGIITPGEDFTAYVLGKKVPA